MKLKKIASLMLAGIMAVSMLAGCKSNENGNGGDVPPAEDTTPTGYSATILNGTSDVTKAIMNSKESTMLSNAVLEAGKVATLTDAIDEMRKTYTNDALADFAVEYTTGVTNANSRVITMFANNMNPTIECPAADINNAAALDNDDIDVEDGAVYAGLYAFSNEMTDVEITNYVESIVNALMAGKPDHENTSSVDWILSAARTDIGTDAYGAVLVGIMIECTVTNAA